MRADVPIGGEHVQVVMKAEIAPLVVPLAATGRLPALRLGGSGLFRSGLAQQRQGRHRGGSANRSRREMDLASGFIMRASQSWRQVGV